MPEANEPLALEAGAHQKLLDLFDKHISDAVLDSHRALGDLWVRVRNDAWHQAVEVVRHQLGWRYFVFLSGIDWMLNPQMSAESSFGGEDDSASKATPAADEAPKFTSGYTGNEGRFQVFCRIHDVPSGIGVTLKTDLEEPGLRVASVADLYRGADWHEREAYEMFGFDFVGHPSLRKLYLPAGFEGHPLRKDFPLLARELKPWPGIVNVEPIPDHLDPKKIEAAQAAEAAAATGGSSDGSAADPAKAKAKADRLAALMAKSKARKGSTGSETPASDGAVPAKPANDRLAALLERSKARKKEREGDQ